MSPTSNLDATLERVRNGSVEFPYLLANHAPIALIALDAEPNCIEAWRRNHRETRGLVKPADGVGPIDMVSREEALDDRSRETDSRALSTNETRRFGVDGVTRLNVPRLVQGVANSALHPLTRLAYGILKDDEQEVGAAIGYRAVCRLPFPAQVENPPDTDDPRVGIVQVAKIASVRTFQPETDPLWRVIRAVVALPDFRPVVDRLAIGPDTPQRMAKAALALFAAARKFAALLAVTGLHWTRLVAPHLDDSEPLYRVQRQVIASLAPKIDFPEPSSLARRSSNQGRAALAANPRRRRGFGRGARH